MGVNISLNNSSSLLFLNVYASLFTPLRQMAELTPFLLSFFPPEISSFWGTSIAITHSWTQEVLPTPRGGSIVLGHLFPLNDPDTSALLHRSSPDLSIAPSFLALSCSWEVLQDLGSDHLPILLSIPLSPVFRPNERPSSFNFQKTHWDDFVSYFDPHCPSAEEYSSLSSAAALFTSLALNAAKSSISFGRIKRHPKAWWSAEVKGAVTKRRAFAAAHRSDEDRQAYITDCRHASSVIAKVKTEAWQTTCTSLSPKSNPKTVYSLLRSVAG